MTRRLSIFTFTGLALLCLAPCRALQQVIKSGSTAAIPVIVTDASGNPVTGVGTAFTATVRIPGSTSYVAGSGTVAEDGNGIYDYTPTSTETTIAATRNVLLVHLVVTATATSFGDASAQIVAFDPNDAASLGLSNMTTAATQATSAATTSTANGTAIAALPSAASIWTYGTRTLTAQSDTAGTTTLLSRLTPTRAGLLDNLDAAVSSRSTYAGADTPGTTTLLALTNVGHTAFTSTALANAPNSGGLNAQQVANAVWDEPTSAHTTAGTFGPLMVGQPVSIWTYSTRALTDKANFTLAGSEYTAVAAAVLSQTLITIPTTGTMTGTSETLTYKQFCALTASLSLGGETNTAPTASGTATVTYYLAGQPKTTGNIVAVSTPAFDASKNLTGRTILIAQPFPVVP